MKLQISGGKYKRTKINIPKDLSNFRPTKVMVREAVCNVLQGRISAAETLELCAGSGMFSMEMISRGARNALAVEQNPKLCTFVKEQINKYTWKEQIEILCEDAVAFLNKIEKKFDIIFFDPPYYVNELTEITINLRNICSKNGVIVFEFASDDDFAKKFIIENCDDCNFRKYGKSSVAFIGGG
ncbi:MAG: RsmD family RNA methyltransferase [Chitinispirillales bacterium]|jgi:16S rRNA (guanine(966)-N(2))-methyltransferase RsmD|nr:RsmD family RNA methyltransferase [Chitinispirillales bacterium]